jgi:predicted O-methyltransferase YrrM
LPARPPLVERALELGFERRCSDETGRLLHVLAGTRGRLRVAEIGSGGLAAAWIVSALDPAVPFFTADREAAELFQGDSNVHVLPGEWRETLPPEAPFDLVYLADEAAPEEVLGLLAPRGLVVARGRAGLDHPALAAAEIAVGPGEAVLLAVRTR